MQIIQSRRDFLAGLSAAGAAGVLGARRIARRRGAAGDDHDPAAPTTRGICVAPVVRRRGPAARGRVHRHPLRPRTVRSCGCADDRDAARSTSASGSRHGGRLHLDAGVPITVLAGVHPGCFELFAHEPIRTISDLKGKKVGIRVARLRPAPVRVDHGGACRARPREGHRLGRRRAAPTPWSCSSQGKVDAFLAFRPSPQELRARKIGHVILNMAMDRPWSQYFCCMLFGNRDFVRDHPVATKRVLRAILKATDICATEPERAARRLVDGGFAQQLRLRAPDADGAAVRPSGASSTRRTRCASTRCACTRSA